MREIERGCCFPMGTKAFECRERVYTPNNNTLKTLIKLAELKKSNL